MLLSTPVETRALTPTESLDVAFSNLEARTSRNLGATFVSALFAGAFIGMGFIFFTTTQVGLAGSTIPVGFGKFLGGLVFSTGLALCIITGADLFTSAAMSTLLLLKKKANPVQIFRHWTVVYLGNAIGAILLAATVKAAGTATQPGWGETVFKIALGKLSHSPIESFFLGLLCNTLVCLAVWMTFAGRTVTDKILGLSFPIALFVASGFEHSIANLFMIPLALMLKGNLATEQNLDQLTITNFLLDNLIPVTFGNIVAASLVAFGMYAMNKTRPLHTFHSNA